MAIDIFSIQKGARISWPGIFGLIILISFTFCEIEQYCETKANEKINGVKKVMVFLVGIFSLIYIDQTFVVIHNANNVDKERWKIAEEIKLQQSTSKWDMDTIVYFPKYDTRDSENSYCEEGGNPTLESNYIRYKLLLKYYGLDDNTIIDYRDN